MFIIQAKKKLQTTKCKGDNCFNDFFHDFFGELLFFKTVNCEEAYNKWNRDKQDWNGILLPKLFWPSVRKNAQVIEKKIWNSRHNPENLQKFWDH